MMYMGDITKYKGNDNKQQKEESKMTTVDKEAMKTGLAGMYANLSSLTPSLSITASTNFIRGS